MSAPIRSQAEQLIEIAERKTQSLRTWGVDESKVNYDLEAGEWWLIRHLADALKDALAARDSRQEQHYWLSRVVTVRIPQLSATEAF